VGTGSHQENASNKELITQQTKSPGDAGGWIMAASAGRDEV
jgi:hypothetical protein